MFLKIASIFFIGSICGWIMELFFRRIVHKKWINPGFLVGPCLPLYGLGLTFLYLISSIDFSFISSTALRIIAIILFITVAMTLLEYLTGLIFIKGLKVQLWDYSSMWGNIQGIICPLFTLCWGAIGAAYYFLLHPHIGTAANFLSTHIASIFIIGALFGIFLIDNIYSFRVVAKIREWAKENNIVVKYENLKLSIRTSAEKLKEKTNFIFSFRSLEKLKAELDEYKKRHSDFFRWKFFKKNKENPENKDEKES